MFEACCCCCCCCVVVYCMHHAYETKSFYLDAEMIGGGGASCGGGANGGGGASGGARLNKAAPLVATSRVSPLSQAPPSTSSITLILGTPLPQPHTCPAVQPAPRGACSPEYPLLETTHLQYPVVGRLLCVRENKSLAHGQLRPN